MARLLGRRTGRAATAAHGSDATASAGSTAQWASPGLRARATRNCAEPTRGVTRTTLRPDPTARDADSTGGATSA